MNDFRVSEMKCKNSRSMRLFLDRVNVKLNNDNADRINDIEPVLIY